MVRRPSALKAIHCREQLSFLDVSTEACNCRHVQVCRIVRLLLHAGDYAELLRQERSGVSFSSLSSACAQ